MIVLILFLIAATLAYSYLRWHFTYWQRRGIPSTGSSFPFGDLDSVVRMKRSFILAIYDAYVSSKEPILGVNLMLRPAILVRDAQIAHDLLTKDFASFHDRGTYVDEENDPMSAGLFFLKGNKWKTLRTKMTPSFSSGKLKGMFPTAENIADKMVAHLNGLIPTEGSIEVEIKKIMQKYAIDVIGSVIFGLDVDSFADPNNEFFLLNKTVDQPTFAGSIRGTTSFLYPSLEKFFVKIGWRQQGPELMRQLAHRTIEYREKNGIVRRDLLQLLLQLRNTGKINADDNNWTAESTADMFKSMSIDVIAAQLFLFYAAGYETTASTAAFTIYELTQNPKILARLQTEITETIAKHGEFTYEAIKDMKYLDMCVKESTRKYPALSILNRECTQNYHVPGTDKIIEKGTPILISLMGIQRDEEYFPDPMRYDPERFSPDAINYNQAAFMPFGDGPRHCIAQRMGTNNVKLAIAKILYNFNLETREKPKEIEFENYGVSLIPKGGIPVRLTRRKLDY